MLGGGHVRRRSVDSGIDGSPCIDKERKKTTALQHLARVLRFDHSEDEMPSSVPDWVPKISPKIIIEKPSFTSTSSNHLGEELMIQAGKGLPQSEIVDDSSIMDDSGDLLASCE